MRILEYTKEIYELISMIRSCKLKVSIDSNFKLYFKTNLFRIPANSWSYQDIKTVINQIIDAPNHLDLDW